jgi:hypothetical protein
MVKTKTRAWDEAEHLETKEDMAAYCFGMLCALGSGHENYMLS